MAFGPRLLALALGACAAVAAAAPASAIFGGTADSATAPLYPEVVAIGYAPPPDSPPEFQGTALQTCVATLVADTVASEARLLTAGHCAAPPDEQLYVSFAADAPPTSSTWTPVPGTVVPQPVTGRDRSDPEDLGVVAIPDSMVPPGITPATLPAAGALSTLRVGEPLTIVGSAASASRRTAAPTTCCAARSRGGTPRRPSRRCGRRSWRSTPTRQPARRAARASPTPAARCSSRTTRLRERYSRPSAAATRSAMQSAASTARIRRPPTTSSDRKASRCPRPGSRASRARPEQVSLCVYRRGASMRVGPASERCLEAEAAATPPLAEAPALDEQRASTGTRAPLPLP